MNHLRAFLRMHADPLFWAILLIFVAVAAIIIKATS